MTTNSLDNPVIVGKPFAPTGRGVTALSHFRALRQAGVSTSVCDVGSRQEINQPRPGIANELGKFLINKPGRSINIYHLNADEIEHAQAVLKHSLPDGAYNIIYPFWELSKYPQKYLDSLAVFDEVWAPSKFIEDALRDGISKPIYHMPLPVEISLSSFLGRSYFGIPDSSYVLLFFFDFRSYLERKNPQALLQVVEKVLSSRPYGDIRIVLKVHGIDVSPKTAGDYRDFLDQIRERNIKDRVIVLEKVYSDNEMRNLVRCCDCFVSLHRSEGFGLGMAEAMYLGKPVVATAYSGNMDFMNENISCLVDYRLIPVEEGQYPFPDGQVWADPDLDQAAYFVQKLFDDRNYGREIGQLASRHIRTNFSYLSMGLRYKWRLDQL